MTASKPSNKIRFINTLDVCRGECVTGLKPARQKADLPETGGLIMDFLGAGLANMAGILIFALVAAGVAKIFSIATTLSEIKDLLTDMKRHSDPAMPTSPFATTEAAESLLRMVSAELEHPVPPAIAEVEQKH